MLKIQDNEFQIKFTEINIRQRIFERESFVTLMINTEFFPSLVDETVISGSVEIKLDLKDIKSLDDLSDKSYEGNIGHVTISVNNNGVWEHDSKDNFKVKINKREGKKMGFELETDNCELKTIGTIVSLYTTSISSKELSNNFDLKDFHSTPIVKEIGNSKISRYYVK